MGMLHQILAEGHELFTGIVALDRRLHPAFKFYDGDYWFLNAPLSDVRRYDFDPDTIKIRILLNLDDLRKLDGLPFTAKMGRCNRLDDDYKFCVLILVSPGPNIIDMVHKWAESKGISAISLVGKSR